MRTYLLSIILVIICTPFYTLTGQKVIKNSSVSGICLAGNKVNRMYIPPPSDLLKKGASATGGSIEVFYTGFSAQAKIATEYAVSVLESILPRNAKVTVSASWERTSSSDVLGSTSVTGYVAGWSIDALNPRALYPLSLAEKIAGQGFNPDSEGDVRLVINSSIDWYYGIDGNTPTNKYDLVTVVMHELIHGLGFFNSMNVSGNTGSYGISSIPFVFDTFVENLTGSRLTDSTKFKNGSTALYAQLTSGNLFFNGPVLSKYTSSVRAKLYAPSTFSSGSSISHLDESQTLKSDALMTPFINLGEAIHDPGKLTVAMLGDLGWVNTKIVHKPLKDTEEALPSVDLSITVSSDTSINRDKVGVVFSFDNFVTQQTRYLVSQSGNNFKTTISIPSYNTDLQYYFFVEDYFKRVYRSPSLYDLLRYQVYIGADTIKPVIEHVPAAYLLKTVDSLKFEALVHDNLAIDTVYVEYRVNENAPQYKGMSEITAGNYKTIFSARSLQLKGGDSLRYRIIAIDSSKGRNTAYFPVKGYISVGIEDIKAPVNSYATNFTSAQGDFFNSGFSIIKPNGFNSNALHTVHPYASPEENGDSLNYIALLRYPVVFSGSGLLFRYREIVLVEPGETGSKFGTEGFYDYVVVEGSKDFGKNWFPFEDGYDSRYNTLWEGLFTNSIVGNNSTYVPSESDMKDHSFFVAPSANLKAGDTLLIRFRLFSDPYANGWGWVVDDLKINPLIDSVEDQKYNDFTAYPNPGNGIINITPVSSADGKQLRYAVINGSGALVRNGYLSTDTQSIIDISDLPKGFYIITLYDKYTIRTVKYSLIH